MAFDDCHDVFLAQHQEFLVVDFDSLPGIFAEQNPVAGFYIERTNSSGRQIIKILGMVLMISRGRSLIVGLLQWVDVRPARLCIAAGMAIAGNAISNCRQLISAALLRNQPMKLIHRPLTKPVPNNRHTQFQHHRQAADDENPGKQLSDAGSPAGRLPEVAGDAPKHSTQHAAAVQWKT